MPNFVKIAKKIAQGACQCCIAPRRWCILISSLHLYLQFFYNIEVTVLGKCCRPFLWHSRTIVCAISMPVQLFSKLWYAVVQLRRKCTLLHWSNIPDLHTGTTDEQFFVFKPVIFFCFDFDLIAVIDRSFCVSMPHFTTIGSLTSEIWRLIDF